MKLSSVLLILALAAFASSSVLLGRPRPAANRKLFIVTDSTANKSIAELNNACELTSDH